MGGQNPNASAMPSMRLHQDSMQNIDYKATKPWDVPSSHPEYISQGIASAIKSIAGSVGGAISAKAMSGPNATGGYDTEAAAKQAAPNAAGFSNVPGVGIVPRAQGVNYEPDQMERLYGYNYSGTGS